jgi:hypothetical protein
MHSVTVGIRIGCRGEYLVLVGPREQGSGENYVFRSFMICTPGKIKKNEMDWACGAYGGGERCAQGFGGVA